ncbi:uncharacterized protein [Zea mays]|uniref:uncharacterized protein isoform X4 n=1 Tax=Zea mays TaxID=4577 RepID=UPI0009AA148B|nr:uncharacterized protein LOC100276797 isoform X4 [Zea mays]|eukprot:XP_020397597.1 uncharacterized protein LOC100276797 isoform X4 [Zea mays]
MGDLKEVFRSLQELFPEVDHRILKAIAIEHRKDVDSAVVTVLDEVMPFMTGSAGVDGSVGNLSSMDGSVGNLFGNHSTHEVGSSSSVWRDICINEIDASVYSVQYTSYGDVKTGKQENINNTYVGRLASIEGVNEQLNLHSYPIPNGGQHDLLPNLDVLSSNTDPEKTLANTDNEVGYSGLFSECFSQPPTGEDGGNIIAPQPCDQDPNGMIPVGDYFPQNSSMEFFSGYEDYNFDDGLLPIGSNDQISFRILGTEKDPFAPVLDVPGRDKEESSTETSGFIESSNNVADMLPDLNLNHFTSTASTHSNHSVSIESLEDSVADARSNKVMHYACCALNDLLPSIELVTKMIEDVELLEEKAKVAKHELSVAGTGILAKVEELREMITYAKEANDMHAGKVLGEKAILTTEARELLSRHQRLSDERNKYLVIIEEIHQILAERLVAAQQEIAAAEKENAEKEAAAQAVLDEQEKMMNSIVEESRKLQKEAEENLKLKEFLVERGQIVDMLQGEMAVTCEDVSLLKRVVDERLPLSKLQRSAMSSLSSSLHSSHHKSWTSSDKAIRSPDKHTLAEPASPVGKDLDGNECTVEVSDGNDSGEGILKRVDSKEDVDGWELC